MARHYLALKNSYGFKSNADNDKHRGAAERNVEARDERKDNGEDGDNSEEYSAYQCNLVERVVDEVAGGLARPDGGKFGGGLALF